MTAFWEEKTGWNLAASQRRDLVLLAAAALLFFGFVFRFFNNAEDDAFIPMRYALNFWRGQGWVMNPGERVEGCTSPLHLALVTVLLRFCSPDQALWVEKLLGILIGLAVLVQARRVGRLLLSSAWVSGLIPLLVASRPEFALSMTNGLETGLATLLLTAGTAEYLAVADAGRAADLRRSAWLFLGAALARPELALTFPLLLALALLGGARPRRILPPLASYGLPLLLCLGLRWLYYGDLVPNTYWAKHLPLDAALLLGRDYLERFALLDCPLLALPLYGVGLFALMRRGRPGIFALPVILTLHLLFLLRAGGDWMVDGRFFVLVLPLCAVVWAAALDLLWRRATLDGPTDTRRRRIASRLLAGLLTVSLAAALGRTTEDAAARVARLTGMRPLNETLRAHAPLEEWRVGNHAGRLAVGRWVAAHASTGQTVLASEMGLITVMNPRVRFLDIRGLTDRSIARLPGCPREISGVQGERIWMADDQSLGRYLHGRRPEWVALLWDVYRSDLTGINASSGLYVPAGRFTIQCDGRPLTVATWRRRDVPKEARSSCHNYRYDTPCPRASTGRRCGDLPGPGEPRPASGPGDLRRRLASAGPHSIYAARWL